MARVFIVFVFGFRTFAVTYFFARFFFCEDAGRVREKRLFERGNARESAAFFFVRRFVDFEVLGIV
jgi:hypothetical protein